ncbi:1-deoxyxylulose-5-phosphate synthase YajO-like [Ylistrum balloti]|uniref:1-deoxyxylulose-5-phosphate synthase YajO-like n=1 Tax=Ylistrum balloti TaxID=509963 RepID=UPI002905D51E|nr:1-deoxyxylulose-5-phosphate synthase YajO-like [Ylistrum balloti]
MLSMGAMTFGRETSKEDSFTMLDIFEEHGGNFIDSANIYSLGISEKIVGEWVQRTNREQHIIATKVRFPMGNTVNERGLGRKHIIHSVHASLKRLKTDYIDVLYAHCWDYSTPLEETMDAFSRLVEEGKVRYIAASNFSPSQLQRACDMSVYEGYQPFIALQSKYNLMIRSVEWELLNVCEENGIGFVVWGPLFGGWLSGRYQRGMTEAPEGRVREAEKHDWFEKWSKYNNETTWNIVDTVGTVAKKHSKSYAQVSLNWLSKQKAISSIILGASKIEHLKDNLACIGWDMDSEDEELLEKASSIELPYPYDFLEKTKE